MKFLSKIRYMAFAMVASMSLVSCEEVLDTQPVNSLPAELLPTRLSYVQGLLTSAYSRLKAANMFGNNLITYPDALADNVEIPSINSGRGIGQETNDFNSLPVTWGTTFVAINEVNLVLRYVDGLPASEASNAVKANIRGQALFLRGLLYYQLVNIYSNNPNYLFGFDHGVPRLTTGFADVTEITLPNRGTVVATYEGIEEDLLASIAAFRQGSGTDEPFEASKAAAHALLARVYLTWAGPSNTSYYPLAEAQADSALNEFTGPDVTPNATFLSAWTDPSDKAFSIFELNYATQLESLGQNSGLQAFYMIVGSAGWGDWRYSTPLFNSFQAGDARLALFNTTSRFVLKFQGAQGSFGWDNIPLIRVEEMVLIKAEAQWFQGEFANAAATLDQLRLERNPTVAPANTLSNADLLTEIDNERRRELFYEGFRFWDLKRRNLTIDKPEGGVFNFNEPQALNAIPQLELDQNPNIQPQNPGY